MTGGFFVAMRVLGLMSGTSADGVDAVLAEFRGPPRRPRWRLLSRAAVPYPHDLRQRLIAAGQGQPTDPPGANFFVFATPLIAPFWADA